MNKTFAPRVVQRKLPRILFGATYSSIEPLGLLYLAGLARDCGWDAHIRLIRQNDFSAFHETVAQLKPEIVGFTCFTGNHLPVYACFERIRKEHPGIRTVIGGPHATYFPKMSLEFADNVVVSEGFDALIRILSGKAGRGILYPTRLIPFPQPERGRFYGDYPEHKINPIKNIISMTGCPFACTYCYNSSNIRETMGKMMNPDEIAALERVMGFSGRLFPINMRTPEAVISEINTVMELSPETKLFYWQDDTLGVARHLGFLKEFLPKYTLGIPFHGQTRFEIIAPKTARGRQVLEIIKTIGFNGLTMAIEAADSVVRKEVLNRAMSDEIIFEAVAALSAGGFRLRTEQITGLPYGATPAKTAINLEADLAILKLNLDLRRQTGLPNIAWATTLIPYLGTAMSDYCIKYGFITAESVLNPEKGYHEFSVLKHLKQHVGPGLLQQKDNPAVWLSAPEQERYRRQNEQLRYHFHILAYLSGLPDAEVFVARHLQKKCDFSTETFNADLRAFVRPQASPEGRRLWNRISAFEQKIPEITAKPAEQGRLRKISAYCSVLPGNPAELARRFLRHSEGCDDIAMLSNITKKYLFDTQVYLTDECTCEVYDTPED